MTYQAHDDKTETTLEARLATAEQDAAYWKGVALYLADCHAATAYSLPKSTSKSARSRFKSICETALNMIEGKAMPRRTMSTLADVADRLRGGMREDT